MRILRFFGSLAEVFPPAFRQPWQDGSPPQFVLLVVVVVTKRDDLGDGHAVRRAFHDANLIPALDGALPHD